MNKLYIAEWFCRLGTDHYKSDGGRGGGEFSACTIFF